jgi:acyl carrier protein
MTEQEVFGEIRALLSKQLNVDTNLIGYESVITEDLGADSLDIAEIALMIKDKFEYDLSDAEMAKIKTVQNIVNVILSKSSNTAGA